MTDLVVWAQYINVTDSHVAIANAAPTHCVGRQKRQILFNVLASLHVYIVCSLVTLLKTNI